MTSIKIGIQFFLYACVGAIACCVDLGLFFLLLELGKVSVLVATTISFSAATLANYYLCFHFIFDRGTHPPFAQILRTFFVAGVGLFFNGLGLLLLTRFGSFPALWAKIFIIPVVMIWNFWARRKFVYSPEIPISTLQTVQRLLGIVEK